jgi:hypothetical protein
MTAVAANARLPSFRKLVCIFFGYSPDFVLKRAPLPAYK